MKKTISWCCLVVGLVSLSACAPLLPSNVTVLHTINENVAGKKFAVYPLDKEKSNQIEYKIISQYLKDKLASKGMIPVDPAKEFASWFVLVDYGVELGIEQAYDRAFLMTVYGENRAQIYKAKIVSPGREKDITNIAPSFIDYLTSEWPGKVRAGESVRITMKAGG